MVPMAKTKKKKKSFLFYSFASVLSCHGNFFISIRLISPEVKLLAPSYLFMFLKPPKPTFVLFRVQAGPDAQEFLSCRVFLKLKYNTLMCSLLVLRSLSYFHSWSPKNSFKHFKSSRKTF